MSRRLIPFHMLLLSLVITASSYGQVGFGSISGRVTDPQGAVIPSIRVTAVNEATNAKKESTTNSSGYYELLDLAPGSYTVVAEASSFKRLVRKGVTVQVEDRISLDLPLQIGQATEVVEVTEIAPMLRETDAQTGEVINHTLIEALPQLNRDPLQLLIVSGNVQGSGKRADGQGMGYFGNDPKNCDDTRAFRRGAWRLPSFTCRVSGQSPEYRQNRKPRVLLNSCRFWRRCLTTITRPLSS